MSKERPLSPHLQVYHWYLTMFLSILHRATGAGLAVGAIVFAWWLMAGASGEQSFAHFNDLASGLFGQLFLGGFLFALVFHFMNGIRHFVWDTGAGLTIKAAYASGVFVLSASVIVTAALWFWVR